jgi:mRNA deadenylase 3'-5' endonuclease subunit Ccr4
LTSRILRSYISKLFAGVEGAVLPFSVATYNVLASAYINRAWYFRSPAMVLNPAWRIPALVQYVSALDADILCLQEVEPDVLAALRTSLAARGYEAHYARKSARRPEGVATLYRKGIFEPIGATRVDYADADGADAHSGYVALITRFRAAHGIIGVINTHLLWDPPGTVLELQRGYRQARQLLTEYGRIAATAGAWVLAGDLNATPDSALIAMIRQRGFEYSHCGILEAASCNVNGTARMIDFIFHSPLLCSEPASITPVDNRTILPSAEQPSDHVAIAACFTWKT